MAIEFLTLSDILEIQRDQLDRYGGQAGLRDIHLLESAVAMPQAGFGGQYLHQDIFEMAAAYLFHIVQNHPFLDGNKRAGAASALVFLTMNDIDLRPDEEGLYSITLAAAEGKAQKPEIAKFFRSLAAVL